MSTRIEEQELTAPAAWAATLINGDSSGLAFWGGDDDVARCEAWMNELASEGWNITDAGESEFGYSCDAYRGAPFNGDVCTYSMYRSVK